MLLKIIGNVTVFFYFCSGRSNDNDILRLMNKNLNDRLSMNRLMFMALGMLMLSVGSCEKYPVSEQQKSLFPLNVGNSWSYNETYYNYYSGQPEYMKTVQTHVVNQYTIDRITVFSLSSTDFSLGDYKGGEPFGLCKNDEEGNTVAYLFNEDKLVHSTFLYKKNLKKGDTWVYKSAVFSDYDFSKYEIEEQTITCITSDTLITTPMGDFHCVGFMHHPGGDINPNGSLSHTMIDFLSENVGLIKHIHYEHSGGRTYLFRERILTDYTLK